MSPGVGNLNGLLVPTMGNLTKIFQKFQMPGGLPGGLPGGDRIIT